MKMSLSTLVVILVFDHVGIASIPIPHLIISLLTQHFLIDCNSAVLIQDAQMLQVRYLYI
jgi:hypothetical protein